jgi:hypothetical protein
METPLNKKKEEGKVNENTGKVRERKQEEGLSMCLTPQELRTVVADTTDSGVSCWSTGRRVILDRQEDEMETRDWEVAHVTEEDFQSTEGETEDLYDKLMEMVGWKVKEFVERVRRFL